MSDVNTNEQPGQIDPVVVIPDGEDKADNAPNGKARREARRLANNSAKPSSPAMPKLLTPSEFAKLDSKAQSEAIKAFRIVQRAKADEERASKPRRGNGGGTNKLLALVLKDAKLNGVPLYAAVKKAGILHRDGKSPLATTTIDTTRYDMAHRVRAILASGMTMAQLKQWLADFDATPRAK